MYYMYGTGMHRGAELTLCNVVSAVPLVAKLWSAFSSSFLPSVTDYFHHLFYLMTTVDRRAANLKKLREAEELQDKTKESIARSQRMAEEAEGLGAQTLDELRRQGEQMVKLSL